MTLQQYIESISRIFPDKGQIEIAIDVNAVNREFCERAMLLYSTITITVIGTDFRNATISYTFNGTTTTITPNTPIAKSGYVSFNMPAKVVAIKGARTFALDNSELYSTIAYETVQNEVRIYDLRNSTTSSLPPTVSKIECEIIVLDNTLVNLSDVPSIPEEFHRALESKVISIYYRRIPIMPSAQPTYINTVAMCKSFEEEFERGIVKAKRLYYIDHNIGQATSALSES